MRHDPAVSRFIVLYVAMYAAYGVASPFLPAFLSARGVGPGELGLLLAASTAVRLLSSPLAGRIADLAQGLRRVLVVCIALACVVAPGYLAAQGFGPLLLVALVHAAALAPMTVLADALALGASSAARNAGSAGFEYGWVRGAGSAAFIAGTLLAGQLVGAWSLDAIVWLQAMLLGAAALAATRVPEFVHRRAPAQARRPGAGVLLLLRLAPFRNVVIAAALVLGSHAMHDAFAMVRWRAAGIGSTTASLLWSEAVAAEVLVFLLAGPALVARLTPAGALALAALAGVLRWAVMAQSSAVTTLALVQPLHGLTFALLHLACMRLIARHVPSGLEGTAQAIYGTVGIGAATALLTLASGALYARFGAHAFWAMAALCALALLPIRRLA